MRPDSPPFFIVGVHRSGTTLLRYMLSSHPRIYIPPETDFIPRFFGRNPHTVLTVEQIATMLNTIFSQYRFVEEWQGDPPSAQTLLERMPDRSPAAFLNTFYSLYACQNNAVRWGDKTPIYASYLDLLHKIFPAAKFIHILRDPFDAAISLLEKYEQEEFHIDIYFAARNWVRRIQHAQASGARLGEDLYYEVRYEHLVQEPENELRALCDFLDEPYDPIMLEHHQLARSVVPPDSHFFANVREPITTQSLGRGRDGLSVADRRLIQTVAGPLMAELDYPLDNLDPMPVQERVRFMWLKSKFETLQFARRIFQALGLVPPI